MSTEPTPVHLLGDALADMVATLRLLCAQAERFERQIGIHAANVTHKMPMLQHSLRDAVRHAENIEIDLEVEAAAAQVAADATEEAYHIAIERAVSASQHRIDRRGTPA